MSSVTYFFPCLKTFVLSSLSPNYLSNAFPCTKNVSTSETPVLTKIYGQASTLTQSRDLPALREDRIHALTHF